MFLNGIVLARQQKSCEDSLCKAVVYIPFYYYKYCSSKPAIFGPEYPLRAGCLQTVYLYMMRTKRHSTSFNMEIYVFIIEQFSIKMHNYACMIIKIIRLVQLWSFIRNLKAIFQLNYYEIIWNANYDNQCYIFYFQTFMHIIHMCCRIF